MVDLPVWPVWGSACLGFGTGWRRPDTFRSILHGPALNRSPEGPMTIDRYTKLVLTLIAAALVVLAARPWLDSAPWARRMGVRTAEAQTPASPAAPGTPATPPTTPPAVPVPVPPQ